MTRVRNIIDDEAGTALPLKKTAIFKKSAGQLLKKARLEHGLKIPQVVQKLNISEHYIKAIETSEFEKLPPQLTYTLGFVRAYAQLMELDAQDIINIFKSEYTKSCPHSDYHSIPVEDLPTAPSYGPAASSKIIILGFVVLSALGYLIMFSKSKTLPQSSTQSYELTLEGNQKKNP